MNDKLNEALENLDNDVIVTGKGITADKKQVAKAYKLLSDSLEYGRSTKFRVRKTIRLLTGKHKAFKTSTALKTKVLLRSWLKESKGAYNG